MRHPPPPNLRRAGSEPRRSNTNGHSDHQPPRECIDDCSHPGPCDADVAHWRELLEFQVEREPAIRYIKSTGAFEREDLEEMTGEEIAERILWLACGTFCEFIVSAERQGADPLHPPEGFDPPSGSNFFSLDA